ncbi:unnamed protein product [Clonostachys rosea f. rosea IK726]|uniref:Uncharacterized protein n=1 Tax=Clonostachys rosea f. rosea IK726 TaxID=1349383 RepID=A0ACA9UND0_BIOOC|nr:unnamed protein product [Clonostachys rosea f. rosea IK726]
MPSISSTAAAVTVGLTGIWVICSSFFLLRNYIKARAIGVPIRVIPVSHSNPFWMLMDRPVLGVLRRFGLESTSFARYGFRLWEIEDRAKSHQEMGPAFILVTPDRNWLYIADPDTINEVFRRRTDFPRCVELTEVLDVFGPSIATAEGARWKVQRKIVTSCFTEPTNEIVWSESLWLAKDMLQYWTSKPSLATTARDCRTLSLNVLSRAGFGKSFKFEGQEEQTSSSETYQGSLQMILENCFLIFAFGTKALGNPWLPEKLNKVHKACEAFQNYMTTMYEEAKGADNSTSKNFIASLVRASQREDEHALTEKELYGNMFTFNFAGHDTTAHTFTFALYFLAAHPDVQAWINEEIREVFKDEDCSYTQSQEQSLNVGGGKTVVIPPNTMVLPSYAAIQSEPDHWGNDPLVWRPSRWIEPTSDSISRPGSEELINWRKGTFLGWSDGARDCPGRKFSQVEFVATMATLFRDWRVDPVLEHGETLESAQERVKKLIETDSGPVLLLQMLHPERAPLKWTRWKAE